MEEKVLEFIKRRFKNDSEWTTGNCYHFALILSTIFNANIYYEPIINHWVTMIDGQFYDYNGVFQQTKYIEPWNDYLHKDLLHSARLIRDCIE